MSGRECRFCRAPLSRVVVDLGTSPLSNSLIDPGAQSQPEQRYPLQVFFCERCHLVQLPQYQTPGDIFSDYVYLSAYSTTWLEHVRAYAQMACRRFALGPQSLVVELASNDGSLLKNFVDLGIPVCGIEPAANVADIARAAGVPTVAKFFGSALAHELAATGQSADLIVANNVLAHVPDINDFVAGVCELLKPNGVVTIEFPHLLRLIERTEFDTIYHEHFSYFSFAVVTEILKAHGLMPFDVEELVTHGGSLRVFAARSEADRARAAACDRMLETERAGRLDSFAGYVDFSRRVKHAKSVFVGFLKDCAKGGKSVAGYGAPAKATTLLNYCEVGTDLVAYTVDRNPLKQGKLIPGVRVPIFAPEKLEQTKPDYVVIFPWNIKDEIARQMAGIAAWGGKFIVPLPTVTIFS